jgi:hypothetical protein
MKRFENDQMDDYIKRRLKNWAGTVRPDPSERKQILLLAMSSIDSNEHMLPKIVRAWLEFFRMDWFFYMENEWMINHHASLRLASYHVATNGHLVL